MAEYVPDARESSTVETSAEVKPPARYRVLMHNDDYTTMDFVVMMLQEVFRRTPEDSVRIMLTIHKSGMGVCGLYSAQVAETKVATVHARAREHGYPLMCSMEPE